MQFASVNNNTLHYEFRNAGAGKTVLVFANSLGTDFRIWDQVADALDQDYSILRYDKCGHGLSGLGKPPYKMDDHVADVEALIDHLGLGKVIICGLSVGGMIAQGLTLKRPELIEAVILCDTGHKIGTAQMWQERIDALNQGGLEPIVDAVMERWFTDAFRRDDNPIFVGCKAMLARQGLDGYVGTCAAIRDTDFTNQLSEIDKPVLCLVGAQDLATPPELVRELSGLISGAEYAEIPNAGHIPCVEQPDALIKVIQNFLRKNAV